MAYGDGDRGVGGWLAFFLVTLGIITPIVTAIGFAVVINDREAAAVFGNSWNTVLTGVGAIAVAQVALCWFVCYRFLKVHNMQTVRIGIGTLILLALAAILFEPMLVAATLGVDLGDVMGAMGADLVRPVVYSTIWSLYLLLSKRVRNTYGSGTVDEMREVFQ